MIIWIFGLTNQTRWVVCWILSPHGICSDNTLGGSGKWYWMFLASTLGWCHRILRHNLPSIKSLLWLNFKISEACIKNACTDNNFVAWKFQSVVAFTKKCTNFDVPDFLDLLLCSMESHPLKNYFFIKGGLPISYLLFYFPKFCLREWIASLLDGWLPFRRFGSWTKGR